MMKNTLSKQRLSSYQKGGELNLENAISRYKWMIDFSKERYRENLTLYYFENDLNPLL
jgi:hypothetical protein